MDLPRGAGWPVRGTVGGRGRPLWVRSHPVGETLVALLLAALVAPLGLLGTEQLLVGLAVLAAGGVLVATLVWPRGTTAVLVLLLTLQIPVLALALHHGVPAPVVNAASLARNLVVAALIAAGVRIAVSHRQRLDRVDGAALVYVGLVGVYVSLALVGPRLFSDVFPDAPDAPRWQLFAVRAHVAGVALLLGVRSLSWSSAGSSTGPSTGSSVTPPAGLSDRDRVSRLVRRSVVVTGAVLAAGAVIESLAPDVWIGLTTGQLGIRRFYEIIHGVQRTGVIEHIVVAGQRLARAGSLIFDDLQLGYLLLPAFALAAARVVRRGRGVVIAGVIGLGILLTLTRSAILGAGVTLITVVVLSRGEPAARRRGRRLVAGTGLAVAVLAVPLGLTTRLAALANPRAASTAIHLDALRRGMATLVDHPLGIGPGTGPGVALRTGGPGVFTENAYLGLATEMGVITAAAFVAFLIVLLRHLSRIRPREEVTVAALAAGAGMAVGAVFLHVWTMLAPVWLFFVLAGLAAPRGGTRPG